MGKKLLQDSDSDNESSLTINQSYAKSYDTWRRKEEYQKLKDKYGEVSQDQLDNMDSSSSDETEDEAEQVWDSDMDKDFFVTLSCLKSKDPRIYDHNKSFFKSQQKEKAEVIPKKTKVKEKSQFLHDYERKLIKKTEQSSDEDEALEDEKGPTYSEELKKIKEGFSKANADIEEDDDDDDGLLLKTRPKTEKEQKKEEEEYVQWLKGNEDTLKNDTLTKDLGFLKDLWGKPKKLDKHEKFLRDYILNKRYQENEDGSYIPNYEELIHDSDENLSEDERTVEQQEEFEHKCNFRFEEPDPEFIKRYPRTIGSSLRKKDDRRKVKRQEVKERKEREKAKKREDLLQLKAMKRKELQEKLERLKEETGNDQLPFQDIDLDEDFDPEKHDEKMKQMFDDDYYAVDEGEQKPEFGDMNDLGIENWDAWQGERDEDNQGDDEDHEPHCEDPDFNMDCDYDPREAAKQEILEATKGRKGRKKKRVSKFRDSARRPKEPWNPEQQNIQEWLDEYYGLDYEDMIGDLPCRFKYREVEPNDFGLTTEEILFSRDKELNRWVSLKKMSQYRCHEEEQRDKALYQRKPQEFKKKVLVSLYGEDEASTSTATANPNKRRKRKKKKKGKKADEQNEEKQDTESEEQKVEKVKTEKKRKREEMESEEPEAGPSGVTSPKKNDKKKRKKKYAFKEDDRSLNPLHMPENRLKLYGINNPRRFKESLKYGKSST